jgi:hypothetical protein
MSNLNLLLPKAQDPFWQVSHNGKSLKIPAYLDGKHQEQTGDVNDNSGTTSLRRTVLSYNWTVTGWYLAVGAPLRA